MPSRAEDWLRQAQRNLAHAERSLEPGDYDWTCFAAHQAGEMAVKALFRALNAEAWGHMISAALDNLPAEEKAPAGLARSAKALDRHYIPSCYPESFGSGTPGALSKTQGGSLSPVKVAFADRKEVLSAATRWLERLAARRPEVVRAILFGSYARDDFGPGSDVALLLILRGHPEPFRRRITVYLPDGVGLPIDVFPYSEDEVAARLAEGDPWMSGILKAGLGVYKRGDDESPHP